MILLLVVELVVFSILSAPNKSVAEVFSGKSIFLKPKNLINIINALPISVFLTTGITLLMISGRLDLSTGANGTLCSMIVAFLLREGVPLIPSLLGAMFAGALIGFINAALVNELRVAPFIGTLATSSIATGFIYFIANKRTIDITDPIMKAYGKEVLWGFVPVSALVAIVIMVIAGIVLHKTHLGRKIYLIGGNPQAAMLSGINPRRVSYVLFTLCGLFSAFAGITFTARQQSANMQGITGARFQGITAAVLGGIAFGGGTGGMAGAFVGLLILNTFSNGLTVIGFSPYLQNIASGLLLIFALTLDYFQKEQSGKFVA
jgi:ribose transport system permease protein